MRKAFLVGLLACMALHVNATNVQRFADNDNLVIELSKTNYNRLFVADDLILKTHFPDQTLNIKNDPDGSVYIDLLSAEPFTVFVSTKAGHNFSLTVKPIDSLGQTVQFVPKTPTVKAALFEKKKPVDKTVTQLIQAMMNNHIPQGYGVKSQFTSYRNLNKELAFKLSKQFVGSAYVGDVMTIYNRSNKPITLDESWFKSSDTRAIALSKPAIAPKSYETIFVVKEVAHA